MLGYLNDEQLTRASLVDGWLASGDLARRDEEGWFWFAGRKKHLIVLASGDNVSPVEVEEALVSQPGIDRCVVVGVQSPEGSELPCAFVVRRDDRVSEATILAALRGKLSDHKLPSRVVFVSELPVGLTGKLLGQDLARREQA